MTATRQITRAQQRMRTRIDWLDGYHSFSFAEHYDPQRMGFGPLRVVNDDTIAPEGGFPAHPHQDMGIVTIVLQGQLKHQDSMGNGRIINAGEIQYMSAGSGVVHSEFNPSASAAVHLMQIWIEPQQRGLAPRYADQPLVGVAPNSWSLILSPDGRDGSISIRQDAELRTVQLDAGASIDYRPADVDRGLWLFVLEGAVQVDGATLAAADSLALTGVDALQLENAASDGSKLLLFDLPLGESSRPGL